MKHLPLNALILAALLFGSVAAFAAPPESVSPGSEAGATIAHGCPTFSWGTVPDADGYEMVVYSAENSESPPVLVQRIAGTASSWTPSIDRCMARGGRYAWTIRALGAEAAPEWSTPLFFDVAAAPSQQDFEKALRIVQQYLAHNTESEVGRSIEVKPALVKDSPPATSTPMSMAGPFETKFSVDGNVEAMSFTGDGASLTGVAKSADFGNHASNAAAHHNRYTDAEAMAAAGPHTIDTDTTCHGQACDGSNFISVDAAKLGGLPPTAYSQGAHTVLPVTAKGDLLVRTATEVVRLPKGKDGQVLIAKSSAPAGVTWGDIVTDYYYDMFAAFAGYLGSDGTLEWDASGWEEDDDSAGPGAGSIRVVTDEVVCATQRCLRIAASEYWDWILEQQEPVKIARTADIDTPGCVSAELSLHVNNQLTSDTVTLEVADDGSNYVQLKDYDGTNGGEYTDAFDITEFISDQTKIRMRAVTNGGQHIYFDNVMISCSALGSG